jgi:glucose-6-phosphate 1-dehydrogenase
VDADAGPISRPEPHIVVIFGATGDLTRRKLLPAFYHLFCEGRVPERFAIVGAGRTRMSDQDFRAYARESVETFGHASIEPGMWAGFSEHVFYATADQESDPALAEVSMRLSEIERLTGPDRQLLFYLATPPVAYTGLVRGLLNGGLNKGAKVVTEKPFGWDLESARDLNAELHTAFDEQQIFRIDHYLGKETVQNVIAFRFANGMFEPVWNRRYIDNVQITVAEEIGIEGRGAFYEMTGSLRDMIQTHLFQTLTFVAMEPPVSLDPDRLRDEKVRVLRSIRPIRPNEVVLGQYVGYRNEEGVAPSSQTPTSAALRVEIDNWRWAGVPFFIRTGKRLKRKVTEISLAFREVPYNLLETEAEPPGKDALTFRVQPDEGISIHLNIKRPGPSMRLQRAELDFDYERAIQLPLLDAYETLLIEAMEGDHTLFLREDEVERSWEVLEPVLRQPPSVEFYEPGSWGPREADRLILPWHWHVRPGPDERDDPSAA